MTDWIRESRLYAVVVIAVLAFAVSAPVFWERGRDSFPLSSYPMFARPSTSALITMEYAVAITRDGERVVVGHDEDRLARAEVDLEAALGALLARPARARGGAHLAIQ